ncbi:hypothetical protein JT359_03680 [Candidatus Poribacteria bacterium]|nr:hypothetical protein [Candidatus Poribacteria bacterium]
MVNYRKLLLLILYSIVFIPTINANQLTSLSLEFTREVTEQDKTEHLAGILHYDVKEARVVVEVTEPIQQLMIVKDSVLEIYYPVEKQAFRFIAEGRIPLPFIESIIQSTQAEYGLTAIGYTLGKHEIVDKILYTHWHPPEKAKEELGTVILGMSDEKLMTAEVKHPKGYIIAKSDYQNHIKFGNNYIPMKVVSSTYGTKSEILQQEQVIYSNPQANTKNPMINFKIPESISVKVVKW